MSEILKGIYMLEFNYTNNIEEIKRGFIRIHNRYALKRAVLFSAVFIIAAVLGADMAIKNPSNFSGYMLTALALGMGAAQWIRPYAVRNRLIKTIEQLNDENYTARFFEDRIEIETDIIEKSGKETELVYISADGIDTVTNPEKAVSPEVLQSVTKAGKTVINIGTEELCSEEDEMMFRLFVNRSLVYIFPKRCMDNEMETALRGYFNEKSI